MKNSYGFMIIQRSVAVLLLAWLVVACTGGTPRGANGPAPSTGSLQAAQAEYEAGRYRQALALFEALAASTPDRRDHYLLRAADAAWEAGDRSDAGRLVATLDSRNLGPTDDALARVLTVATRGSELPPHQRLALLDRSTGLAESYRALFHRMKAAALLESGQAYAAATELIRLEPWLLDPDLQAANRLEILRALQQLTTEQARRLMTLNDPGAEVVGWLDLVASVKDALYAGQPLARAVADWEQRYPGHPAAIDVSERIVSDYGVGVSAPASVAVLLPENGPLSTAAQSVRDGLATAFYGEGSSGALRFYDSGPDPDRAMAAYRQALLDGADIVIGPLDRAAAAAIVLEADGSVPVLALNYADGSEPAASGVYQFGLLPEDEARAAAEQMLTDGHGRAVVLTPNSTWGDRLRNAFIEHFTALGGVVFTTAVYADNANDFGATIERIVGLQDARQRHRELESDLGLRMRFTPTRRPDLDALFLAARPREGRLIKPQLAFNSAGDLPVYATSHVFAGTIDPERDKDLEAIRFCDAPWVIQSQGFAVELDAAREAFSSADDGRARLFALGYDSFRVLPYLEWLSRFPEDRFPGATGRLRIAAGGQVLRSPDCAAFIRGRPRYLEPKLDEALLTF